MQSLEFSPHDKLSSLLGHRTSLSPCISEPKSPTTCNRNSWRLEGEGRFSSWPRTRSPGLCYVFCPTVSLNSCSDPAVPSLSSQVFTQEVRTLLAFRLTARCSISWEPGTMGQDWKAAGQDFSHPPELGRRVTGNKQVCFVIRKG